MIGTAMRDVMKDLAAQTETAVKDERIPLTPEGIAEWFKTISEVEEEVNGEQK